MLDIIAIIIAVVAVYHAQKTSTQLWHVLTIAIASLILVSVMFLPQEFFAVPNHWIVFTLGILVGIISVIYSYKYTSIIEKKVLAEDKQEWEEKWAREKKEGKWS